MTEQPLPKPGGRPVTPEVRRLLDERENLEGMVRMMAGQRFKTEIGLTQTKVVALRYREALAELVELKALKDSHGKTAEYVERQSKAWEMARKHLDHTPAEALTPYWDYVAALEKVAEAARSARRRLVDGFFCRGVEQEAANLKETLAALDGAKQVIEERGD